MSITGKRTLASIAGVIFAGVLGFFGSKLVTVGNGETRYQRPGPHAGALAQRWWDFYWTGNADQNRCYFLPAGRIVPPSPPSPAPCVGAIPCVPHAPAASGVFDPGLFPCPYDPTKTCYKNQFGVTGPISPSMAGRSVGLGPAHGVGIVGEDGVAYGMVDQCPNQPITPGPSPSSTPPGKTPTPVVTSCPSAPTCTPVPACPCRPA